MYLGFTCNLYRAHRHCAVDLGIASVWFLNLTSIAELYVWAPAWSHILEIGLEINSTAILTLPQLLVTGENVGSYWLTTKSDCP